MTNDPLAVARSCYEAYVEKDRGKLEALLAADYRFTSPLDNALDRTAYLTICWPNSASIDGFDYVHQAAEDDRAFVIYEARTKSGKRFRNSEVHTVRDGKLLATEVYFGWNLPHDAPNGQHKDKP